MTAFEINIGNGYVLRFHSGERDTNLILLDYCVDLISPKVKGTFKIYNPPFAHPPDEFLIQLAQNWRGWDGKKTWASLEGELRFSATSDSTGHTYLVASARTRVDSEPNYTELIVTYAIEAGQLAQIAKDAKEFFK